MLNRMFENGSNRTKLCTYGQLNFKNRTVYMYINGFSNK